MCPNTRSALRAQRNATGFRACRSVHGLLRWLCCNLIYPCARTDCARSDRVPGRLEDRNMPPAKAPRWEWRPKRQAGVSGFYADLPETPPQEQPLRLTAVERRQLFARLLWLADLAG